MTSLQTEIEYIEPLSTSPLTFTERSLTNPTTDNISMQINPAYYRMKYFGNIPNTIYENPDRVRREGSQRYIQPTTQRNTAVNQDYITILP